MVHRPPGRSSDGDWRAAGFTVIEVLIVVAIAAIATAVVVPTFLSTIRANRLDAAGAELRAALRLARSEAVKRATLVVAEPINPSDWAGGLRIYVDADLDPSTGYTSSRDTVVRENALRHAVLTTSPGAPARVAFDAVGRNVALGATASARTPIASTIQLCASAQGRRVDINPAGFVGSVDAPC